MNFFEAVICLRWYWHALAAVVAAIGGVLGVVAIEAVKAAV